MTNSLMNDIVGIIAKEKIGATKEFIDSYRTPLSLFDHRNGSYDLERDKAILGLTAGSLTTIIGKSGSGKTAYAIQSGTAIADQFKDSQIIHLDYERSTSINRIQSLSGWSDKKLKEKYILLNSNISAESLFSLCKATSKIKDERRKELQYDTGRVDEDGKKIYELPPTIVIVDSIATMFAKDNNEKEELGGQMESTAQAKTNNRIIKALIGSSALEVGNILIIAINHITTKIDINAFAKTPAELNYLSPNEATPGGTSFPFMSNVLIKVSAKDKLDPDAKSSSATKYGIKGFIAELELIKSRTAASGQKIRVVYSQQDGFLDNMTNLINLDDLGYIKGTPTGKFIESMPDVKFSNKTFRQVYDTNPEFSKAFDKLASDVYVEAIPRSAKMTEAVKTKTNDDGLSITLEDKEQDIWSGPDGKFYDGNFEEIEVDIAPE